MIRKHGTGEIIEEPDKVTPLFPDKDQEPEPPVVESADRDSENPPQ